VECSEIGVGANPKTVVGAPRARRKMVMERFMRTFNCAIGVDEAQALLRDAGESVVYELGVLDVNGREVKSRWK